MSVTRSLERLCWLGGLAVLGVFLAEFGLARMQAANAVTAFEQAGLEAIPAPDTALWSSERIAAYEESRARDRAVMAVLRVESVSIEAPVFAGTSNEILDSGVGWIEGTARPGSAGNVGLAAHRDGFFRALKDVAVGDAIRLSTDHGEQIYTVTGTAIVSPDDTFVLEPTAGHALTLVTCHPFYFVGNAPNRFTVFALAADESS